MRTSTQLAVNTPGVLHFSADCTRSYNELFKLLKINDVTKLSLSPGKLYPEGLKFLKNAEDREEVRRICERFGAYKELYNGVGDGPNDKTLEDKFFEEEVCLENS